MIAAARSRGPSASSCSDLQSAGPEPLRPAVSGREDSTTDTNKIVYLQRRLANTDDFGYVGMDFGSSLQSAGVCRNNDKVVDKTREAAVITSGCTHGPCVCVYIVAPREGVGVGRKDETARRRCVSERTHTSSVGSYLPTLLCSGGKLHPLLSESGQEWVQTAPTLGGDV